MSCAACPFSPSRHQDPWHESPLTRLIFLEQKKQERIFPSRNQGSLTTPPEAGLPTRLWGWGRDRGWWVPQEVGTYGCIHRYVLAQAAEIADIYADLHVLEKEIPENADVSKWKVEDWKEIVERLRCVRKLSLVWQPRVSAIVSAVSASMMF